MSVISLLVALLLFCLAAWVAQKLLGAFGIPEPIPTIVLVIIVIVFVLWVVQQLGGGASLPVLHLR